MSDIDNARKLFFEGLEYLESQNFGAAEASFVETLKLAPRSIPALNNLAIAQYKQKKIDEATLTSRRAVEIEQNNVDAYSMLATCQRLKNLHKEALATCDKIISLNPMRADAHCNRGCALNELHRYDEALLSFDRATAIEPNFSEAHLNRGNSLRNLKRYDEALAAYDAALKFNNDLGEAWLGRGNVFTELKRHGDAFDAYDKALILKPDLAEAWIGRAKIFFERRRYDESLAAYDKALAFKPDLAEGWLGLGNIFTELKRYDDALAAYDKALAFKPDLAEGWLGRGNVFAELKRFEEGFVAYDKALAFKPDLAEAWLGRGNAFTELERFDEAFAAYDKAIALKPNLAAAWLGRGAIFRERNLNDNAIKDYEKSFITDPDFIEGRFSACFAELPILYAHEGEIDTRRESYEKKLRALKDDVESGRAQGDLVKAIEISGPFYLAYQGRNDRDLQQLYSSMVCAIMERKYSNVCLPPRVRAHESVRVGIVSSFFRMHSNWKIPIKGWMSQLDRSRFKIFAYHTGREHDAETDIAMALCDRFVERVRTVEDWRREILADTPHVLIYPGLFMDGKSVQLAAQRLAPVQCTSWGHPETSGMPTIDYYLGSDLMEPENAAEHYTERLIRLPNLSVYYEPIETEPATMRRAELGLRSDTVAFWCGQSLYKFLPQFDQVFANIAKQVGNCQFVFLQYHGAQQVTQFFQDRLDQAFESHNLKASDYVIMAPRLSQNQYAAALGQCDIFLDSIGWSGCNSTLESLPHNIPIVTMLGTLMRGRHSAAILRMMGIAETIANDVDEYTAIAVRLAKNPDERRALGRKISSNKYRLYRDRSCIVALEDFLDRVAR